MCFNLHIVEGRVPKVAHTCSHISYNSQKAQLGPSPQVLLYTASRKYEQYKSV